MMRDILDTHTHTLASGHAYRTIRENAHAAAEKGLSFWPSRSMPPDCGEAAKPSIFKICVW